VELVGAVALAVVGAAGPVAAGTACRLPRELAIAAEQRSAVAEGGPGVVAGTQPGARSPLRPGDGVRQAGGVRVTSCDELERAAAEAFAKGLPLLLAVERDGVLVPLLIEAGPVAEAAAAPGARAGAAAVVPGAAVAARDVPAPVRTLAEESAAAAEGATPETAGAATPEPVAVISEPPIALRPPIALPPASEAPAEARAAAMEAVRHLRDLDSVARATVPLVVYEGRLQRTERSIAAMGFGSGAAAADVKASADEVLATHHTVAEIRRATLEYLTDTGRRLRTVAVSSMPYFSSSEVPRWVAEYPFLEQAVIEPPRATRFLIPGEASGSWNPDEAVALLWGHAREQTAQIAAWAGAD